MATNKRNINEIKSKLEVIKKINDSPKTYVDNIYDSYIKNIGDEVFSGKKTSDFKNKRNSKNESGDIFSNLIDIADGFIGFNKVQTYLDKDYRDVEGLLFKSKLKQYAIESAKKTSESSKDIVADSIKKAFFVSDGICGTDREITTSSVTMSPKDFDFFNVLTIDPQKSVGKVIYEPQTISSNKIKFDRVLYEQFSSGSTPYNFVTANGDNLFDVSWNATAQEYTFSGLTVTPISMANFISKYYSSIEMPNIDYIIKTAMLLTINGDGSETKSFNISLNKLDRLLKKLFSLCGSSNVDNNTTSPVDNFNENDDDVEFYFDFNNVEGIDIDSEENRLNHVLKFTDCNNFEIPTNPKMIESFIYFSNKRNLNDLVSSTLDRVGTDSYYESDSSIPEDKYIQFLFNTFILNVPKALILSVFTPKMFFPIVLLYKLIIGGALTVEGIMKFLYKLFYSIIKQLFWRFIREFWKLIKKELINFISKIVQKIIKNMLKRYRTIVLALIAIIKKVLESDITNCDDLFGSILKTINGALASQVNISVPGILLILSDLLPGYSQDRALMNISERLEASGISLAPLFGEENELPSLIKSIIDGNAEEIDANSYVKVSNKPVIIPSYPTPIVIPPGIMTNVGKIF